jgi:thiamine biosynthesis lipoprotein
MYSRFELFIPLVESAKLESIFQEIVKKAEQLEKQISKFIPESETSRINSSIAFEPVKVNSSFFALIEQCFSFYKRTLGYYAICTGNQTITDGFGITLNSQTQSVNLNASGIVADFGGIGKGLVVEMASELLRNNGITRALINFGDSSVYGLGSHPHGDYWPVTITNGTNSKTFRLENKALSSSGLHLVDDTLVPHIIDPQTGKVVEKNEKVVVISSSPVIAEVLSTAIYAAPDDARGKIKMNFPDEVYIL